jgi:hypothetical protein
MRVSPIGANTAMMGCTVIKNAVIKEVLMI